MTAVYRALDGLWHIPRQGRKQNPSATICGLVSHGIPQTREVTCPKCKEMQGGK